MTRYSLLLMGLLVGSAMGQSAAPIVDPTPLQELEIWQSRGQLKMFVMGKVWRLVPDVAEPFDSSCCTIPPDTRKPAPSNVPKAGDLEQLDQWRYRVYDGEEWIEYDERNDAHPTAAPVTLGAPPSFGVEEIPATDAIDDASPVGLCEPGEKPELFGEYCSRPHPTCPKSGTWIMEKATNGKSFCRKVQGQ